MSNNIPKIRFPEFTDEWQEKKLGEIATIERGRFSPRPRNDPRYYNGDIPFVQTSNVVKSNGVISEYNQTLNQDGLKVSKLFPKGTILITIAANIGYTGILKIDMACPDSLIGIKCNKNQIDNKFLNYFLVTQHEKMDRIASEAAQKNINIEFLRPYKIPFTSLEEQQKIADFLMAVDEKIQLLEEKKKGFEKYKKGAMQAIFSQKIRFKKPDGSGYPDWEEKKLGDILKEKNERTEETKKHAVLSSTAKGIFRQDEYFNREIASSDSTGYKIIHLNQLVFSPQNLWLGNININRKYEIGIVSPSYKIFDIIDSDITFVENLLKTPRMLYEYLQASEQGASVVRRNLDINSFMTIKIIVPSIEEQKKIGGFFDSLDNEVDLINKQLEQTRLFKKSLLQQMFV